MNDPTPAKAQPAASTPQLTINGGCATLTLNRPAHHNRLQVEDLLALRQCFNDLAAMSDLRVLVLTGSGPSFCSGFDLGALAAQVEAATEGPRLFEQTVDALEALPMPTVCRLNGGVFGGATDLALACDFRIGIQGMSLRMPAVRLGLHYYPSGLQRYVSRLGLATAKRLFLLAETLPADELLRIGYLDQLCAPDQLDGAVQAVVEALCAAAPLAARGMKASLNEIARGEFDRGRLREREQQCAGSADLREGQRAFAEKRAPRFSGR